MSWWQAVVFLLLLLYAFLTFYYNDMAITSQYGVVFLDSIFDGRPLSFYENCVRANVTPEGAVYDIGIYVIFGIWSIPVWLLRNTLGISVVSTGAILWYKVLPVLFLAADTALLMQLAERLGLNEKEKHEAAVLFWLTPLCFFPVFVAIQYDVIILYFMLRGILEYMDGSQKKFLFWMALSLTMKPFPAFVLGLLVVGKEKNVFRIALQVLAGASLMLLCKVAYSFNRSYQETNASFLTGKFQRLFTIQVADGKVIPVFVIALCCIYLYVWLAEGEHPLIGRMKKTDEDHHADRVAETGESLQTGHVTETDESLQAGRVAETDNNPLAECAAGRGKNPQAADTQGVPMSKTASVVQNRRILFWIAAVWACFVMFADIFPYWSAYYAPFSVLFLFLDDEPQRFRRNLRLSFAGNVCLLAVFVYKYYWVYGGSTTYASLLLKPLYEAVGMAQKNTTVGGGLGRFGMGYLQLLFYLIFVGVTCFLLWSTWHYGCRGKGREEETQMGQEESVLAVHRQYTAHLLLIACWIVLTLAALLLKR